MVTEHEAKLAQMLGDVWNEYLKLPKEHPNEQGEFCAAIHACQNIVLSRSGCRQLAERAKRMQAERQQPHRAPTSEDASKSGQLDQFIAKNTGRRMTCSEIYQQCFNFKEIPPRHWLVIIGGKLRTIGCEKVRSGGKDYFQL